MVALASSFAPPPLLVLNTPPVPLAAVFDTSAETAVVVFDKDLDVASFDVEELNFFVGGKVWQYELPSVINGNVMSGDVLETDEQSTDNTVRYTGFPDGLSGVNEKPVENFNIPVTLDVPVPLSATYSTGTGEIRILFDREVVFNTATKTDFGAIVIPNTLNVQSVGKSGPVTVVLSTSVNGPGVGPDRVLYNGRVDGLEDLLGNDVPLFEIGLDIIA